MNQSGLQNMNINKLKRLIFRSPQFETILLSDLEWVNFDVSKNQEESLFEDRNLDLFNAYLESLNIADLDQQEILSLAIDHGYSIENSRESSERNKELQSDVEVI